MAVSYGQRNGSVATHLNGRFVTAAQIRDLRVLRVCRTRVAPQQNGHKEKQGGIHKPL